MTRNGIIAGLEAGTLQKARVGVCPWCGKAFDVGPRQHPRYTCGDRHCRGVVQSCWSDIRHKRKTQQPVKVAAPAGDRGAVAVDAPAGASTGAPAGAPAGAFAGPCVEPLGPWTANYGDGFCRQPDLAWGF